ncbi:NIP3-like protein [Aphelenchoides fujianensis]|nr:NIP3-like protein [Aphelenchoides fujianensis]
MSFFERQPPLFDAKKRLGNVSGNGGASSTSDRPAQPSNMQSDDVESQAESWVELAPSRASLVQQRRGGDGRSGQRGRDPVSIQSQHVEFEPNLEQVKFQLVKDMFPAAKNTEWIWDWSSRPETIAPNRFLLRNRSGQVGSALTTPPNSPEPELASEFEFKPGKTKKWIFYRFEVLVGLVVSNLVTFVIGATVGFCICKKISKRHDMY